MALQPSTTDPINRQTTPPFLLRLFYRSSRALDPYEFSLAPPPDATASTEYYSILPAHIQDHCVELYQWPDVNLGQLTSLLMERLGGEEGLDVGARVVFKLIFPDTRAQMGEGGRGKWIDKPLGVVTVGGTTGIKAEGDEETEENIMEGDSLKTLADARFVIGDYVACAIYPPGAAVPAAGGRGGRGGGGFGGGREMYAAPRGGRENGFGGGGGYGRGGGGFRGGYGGGGERGGFGGAPPVGDWRRGERPPGGAFGGGGFGGGGGGGFRGGRGRGY